MNHVPEMLRVGIAQIAPVWLDRARTLDKMVSWAVDASDKGCKLLAFGETVLPGFPFWTELTDGARFDSDVQKDIFAHYLDQAININQGHLKPLMEVAKKGSMTIFVGCAERPTDRGGHSVYCSLVRIGPNGEIENIHRKLMPTFEERLTWAFGDGHGLRTDKVGPFTVGGLNCWENMMPLARTALYALGEDLHIAVWPGGSHNTQSITQFAATEMRGFVVAASAIIRPEDVPAHIPHRDVILADPVAFQRDGGSAIAAPDGRWIVEPVKNEEKLIIADLDFRQVLRERQNFDPVGHYARADVLRLVVDRRRQRSIELID